MLGIMPAHIDPGSDLERELLAQLGARLKDARLVRGVAASSLARQLGVSRTTLSAVEAGNASVTMGTYLRVMSALGMAADLVMLANRAAEPGTRARQQGREPLDLHQRQDLRSLALHEEAVRVLRRHPERAERALQVLARWEATADPHSKPLRDEWRRIIKGRRWNLAVEDSDHGQQLRQASPLGFVLDDSVRNEIIRRYSRASLNESLAA
jgi:transcriptional regulator with XRE-family HTH domain